jgi:type I restriction enzyme S subunit
MKDSGVAWLGRVPEHWQVSPAFAAYRPRQVKNTGLVESTVLSLSYGRIIVKAPEKLRGLVPESFETYQIVEPGNIIVRTTDLQNDQTSQRIGHARHRGIITAAYMCLETRPIVLNEFGYQYLNAYDRLKIIYGYGSGLRQNLDFSDIKRMPVLVPPRDEQAAIVRFLDHADRRIRRYIRAKQKLIKLLEEQKQAIIHRAVTRGLDPNVRLKPSGVEWLGDVPEHWEAVPFKRRVGFQEGPGIMAVDFRDAGIPLLRISCLRGAVATLNGCNFLGPEMVRRRWSHFEVRVGDYLLSASASTGSVVLADEAVAGSIPYTGIIRLWAISEQVSMPFMRLYMGSAIFQDQIDAAKSGVAIEHFGPTHLKRMWIALPPLAEQRAIADYVEKATAPLAAVAARCEREISLLREYRTRLIADVVTGKLDVREAAARLPQEAEDLEPLDETEVLGQMEGESAANDLEPESQEADA